MSEEDFKRVNAELGVEFLLFTLEHPEWAAEHIPADAIVVLQTEDEAFNAWVRNLAEQARHTEQPPRPLALVHLCELRPPQSRIVRAEVELLPSPQQAL